MSRIKRIALSTIKNQVCQRAVTHLQFLLFLVCAGTAAALTPPEYPVILVHGLGLPPLFSTDASTWNTFRDEVVRQGWIFGGELRYRNNSVSGTVVRGDFYTITFSSDHNLTYYEQAVELENVIEHILRLNDKRKAICVGHSMGGLACRAYLKFAQEPRVSQIITVGTPHLGSHLDRLLFLAGMIPVVPDPSTAVRILQVGSPELNELNTDTIHRYRDTPVAYSSIIVDNDDLVPEVSQSLAGVDVDVPLHNEVRIRLDRACIFGRIKHICETSDDNVRLAITSEIVRRPVALVLKAETPVTRRGLPLRIKLFASSANREGDLYLAASPPGGGFLFQQGIGSGDLEWTLTPLPAARSVPAEEFYAINLERLDAEVPTGSFDYRAVLARTGSDPFDHSWFSNLASAQFRTTTGEGMIITPETLPQALANWPYHATLGAIGGTPPYTWLVVDGNLPPGMALSASGTISGASTVISAFSFTVQVRDSSYPPKSMTADFTIEVRSWLLPPGIGLPPGPGDGSGTGPDSTPSGGPSPSPPPPPPSGGGGPPTWGEVPPWIFD